MRALTVVSTVLELKDVWHGPASHTIVAPDAGSCVEVVGNQDVLTEELWLSEAFRWLYGGP